MQQTDSQFCQQISVGATALGLYKTDNTLVNNCDVTAFADAGKDTFYSNTSVRVESDHAVSFSTNGLVTPFAFDQMGRVINSSGNRVNCANANSCQIVVTGENTLVIKIEQEGYIHAF